MLALSVAASLWPSPSAADPTVFIAPPSLLIDPGESATLQVRVDASGDPISCFIVQIHFDPAVFTVTDAHEGALFDQSPFPTYPDWQLVAPDTLQLANCVLGSGTFVLGPGELVAFDIEGVAPGESPVELAFAQVRDIDRIPYGMTQIENGEVVVWDPTGVEEPASGAVTSRPVLRIQPNPSPGRVQVSLLYGESSRTRAATVDVYDVTGRLCDSFLIRPDRGVTVWKAETSRTGNLPAGVYIMRLRDTPNIATRFTIID